jgi:hypothetical protein
MSSTISTISYIDLLKKLRRVDISVPPISQGRTKIHTERWTMYRVLVTFGDRQGFTYPMTISHKDKPDFRLEMPDRIVGAEVTSAMPEVYGRALVLREKFYPNAPLELDHFRWGGPKLSSKQILAILKESQKRLTGMGWVGDSVEREWADAIAGSYQAKTESLNSDGFQRFQWNWLLVYDNVPQAALDLPLGVRHLLSKLAALSDKLPNSARQFDTLFIESHSQFVVIEKGNWSAVKIRNLWRQRGS